MGGTDARAGARSKTPSWGEETQLITVLAEGAAMELRADPPTHIYCHQGTADWNYFHPIS